MKKIFIIALVLSNFNLFSQQIRTIDTDSVVFYIDTQVSGPLNWGGATYNGTAHVGTNTYAYSQSNGILNTQTIISAIGAGTYPASRCNNLVLDNKDDWYLPSGDESKIVFNSLNSLGVIPQGWYWTSSDENSTPYTSFFTYDAWAWKKWFGGGEGDIFELDLKIQEFSSFCIRKEIKTNGTIMLNAEKEPINFKYYDLVGKETTRLSNTLLIKKFENGVCEKVYYPN